MQIFFETNSQWRTWSAYSMYSLMHTPILGKMYVVLEAENASITQMHPLRLNHKPLRDK